VIALGMMAVERMRLRAARPLPPRPPGDRTLMLLMHMGLLVLIDFADLSVAMIVVQLFTFDREWLSILRRAPFRWPARPMLSS